MPDTRTLHEKYVELVEAGYITPIDPAPPLEMPTALVYVPIYSSEDTTLYNDQADREGQSGKLVGRPARDQPHR
jgi:hypothetical protein